MHEISLCEDIRTTLEDEAVKQNFNQVTKIWLDIGPLSCVEPEALRFGFDAVMRGSVAEGAALEIHAPKGDAYCLACHSKVQVISRFDTCPNCGAAELRITGGDALKIRKLEVV